MIYDYIIIGGGPCGLTIANTLSKKFKILTFIIKVHKKGI